jgi:hypothetical protein
MLVKARVGFEEPVELADHSAEARVVRDYLEAGWQHPRKVADPSGERSGRVRSTRLSGKVAGYISTWAPGAMIAASPGPVQSSPTGTAPLAELAP